MSGHPSPDPATELRVGNRLSGFPRNGLSALCRTRFSLQTQCVAIDNMCAVWYIASLRKGSKLTAVWTIGHSTHDRPKFERLLAAADIGAVADVRSFPSSRLPHFGRAALAARLNASGIAYVYLGRELGADVETNRRRTMRRWPSSLCSLRGWRRSKQSPRACGSL